MTDPLAGGTSAAAVKPATSSWEDALDIFYSPRAVFERRRDGTYLWPLLVLCVLSTLVYLLSQQMNIALQDAEFARVMRENPMPAEEAKSAREMGEKFSAFSVYLIPVFTTIGAWLGGLILMGIGKLMGAKLNFAQATVITVLAAMPELLGRTIVGVQSLFMDMGTMQHRYSMSLNAARFLPGDANKWMLKFAALADPFFIWGIVLIGVGAYIVGSMEKEKAAVLAIVVALVTTLLFR